MAEAKTDGLRGMEPGGGNGGGGGGMHSTGDLSSSLFGLAGEVPGMMHSH